MKKRSSVEKDKRISQFGNDNDKKIFSQNKSWAERFGIN